MVPLRPRDARDCCRTPRCTGSRSIHRHPERQVQFIGAARDGRDDSAGHPFAHAVVLRVGDIDVARRIHGQPLRPAELSAGSRAAVTRGARGAGARENGDHAVGRHAAHHVVERVGDIDVTGAIHRHAQRRVELSAGSRAAIAGPADPAVSCHGGNGGARQLAHAVIQRVGEIQVAARIHRHAGGQAEPRGGRGRAIAGEPLHAVAHRGRDIAFGIDLPNPVAAHFGHKNIAAAIHGHAEWGDHGDLDGYAIAEARWPPLPATVETVPSIATLRMVALPVSATSADPSERNVMSCGPVQPRQGAAAPVSP